MRISNVSLRALIVAIRWCRMNNFPTSLNTWSNEQNKKAQWLAEEVDRR